MQIETLAIHAGQPPDPVTGAVMTPIYQSSTFVQTRIGEHGGYEYGRTANPTRSALQDCLAALEGGLHGLAFASGMAAIDAVLRTLEPGDHVLSGRDVYGGSYRLFEREFRRYGMLFDYVDTSDLDQIASGLRPQTRMVWLESPGNPMLKITDLAGTADLVRAHPATPLIVVDNTFATPYLQRPLDLGADVVVHSTTKYLGGHSDVVGGALVTNRGDLYQRLAFLQNAAGAVPGPLDAFLVLRGIKTLAVRMDRHASNASAVAEFLASHPKVGWIAYPFHPSHPQSLLARRQMRNGGGMVSFGLQGGAQAARKAAERTQLFALAESLGGVESLIEVPAEMTHASTSGSPLAVDPGLVRLSVGLEHVEDLIGDLEQALQAD